MLVICNLFLIKGVIVSIREQHIEVRMKSTAALAVHLD